MRQNNAVSSGCGSAQIVLTPGTYRVETMNNVFVPFDVAIEAGKTTTIQVSGGKIAIK